MAMHPLIRSVILSAIAVPAAAQVTGEPAVPRSSGQGGAGTEYSVTVEPGEGVILLLGDEQQLRAVRQQYFGQAQTRRGIGRSGKVDRLLLGFYTGADVASRAQRLGLSEEQYVDRMLQLYREAGATAVFVYRGNMAGGVGARFAGRAAVAGLKTILQPNDLYFRSHHMWLSPAHRDGLLKGYADPSDYLRRFLLPHLETWAPATAADRSILAWGPVEELPAEDEGVYTEYKKAFRRLLPEHLIYQLDSPQATREKLRRKQPPYPDICGFDRYPWWTRPEGTGLWTPHHAARWFFNVTKDYARDVHELFGAPAILVMQGCAELSWPGAAWGERYGWRAERNFIPARASHVRWIPEVGKFRVTNRHLAPQNAWRLQCWLGIARGYKGLMFWSAGPASSPGNWREAWRNGTTSRLCLIHDDFTAHRYLAEVTRVWSDIRRYETLLLDCVPVPDMAAPPRTEERYVYTGLLRDSAGRDYIVVVNGQIGTWDGTSPEVLKYPDTTLSLDTMGEYANYTPLEAARTIRIHLRQGGVTPYDLRTMAALAPADRSID